MDYVQRLLDSDSGEKFIELGKATYRFNEAANAYSDVVCAPCVDTSSYYRGDADADGVVSVLDATIIQRRLAVLPVSPLFNEKAAEVSGDDLNLLDATAIQRYLASLSNPYQIGEYVNESAYPVYDEYLMPEMGS